MLFLLVATAAALVASGCSVARANREVPSDPVTSTTQPLLVPPARYEPLPGEPAPEVKQLASDVLQRLGTYPAGAGRVAAVERLGGLSAEPRVVTDAAALLDPAAAASAEVVYPQLGGLTTTDASVMVVVRQQLLAGGAKHAVTRTIDVRLRRDESGWRVTEIASVGGEPAEPVALSAGAQAILANPAIELADSARWDIEAGRIDGRVLQLLVGLAEKHTLAVTVLASGHPHNVFASESVSNHTAGRAVDIWAVDGVPVVSQRDPAGALHALVAELLANGVTELGSPWDLDGPGAGSSFTNTVHQDHLHLAFDG